MTVEDFITELFCRVDDEMLDVTKHAQAKLYPSEVVTLGLAFAFKGVGSRAHYRWAQRNFGHLFPHLPERTRFYRLLKRHRVWLLRFVAKPSLIGLIDSFGIELLHPRREGRSHQQIGRKGTSNRRWIVGGKLCVLLNHLGLVVDWACQYPGRAHGARHNRASSTCTGSAAGRATKPYCMAACLNWSCFICRISDPAWTGRITMASNALLLIPIFLIGVGLLLLWLSRRKRQEIQMPPGTPIYQDTQEQPGTILYSKTYGLKGKPDFLLKEQDLIIPVEAKTGKTPRFPYFGHIMQLIVYCMLVEENYGIRPPYGVIRYNEQQFRIEFTKERELTLSQILIDMRQKRATDDLHRSHNNPKVCASCGFREQCNERLDVQMTLPLDI